MSERIAFNYGGLAGTHVPSRAEAMRRQAGDVVMETVAVLVEAGRDWAYLGLLSFTLLLFFRPQDEFPAFGWFHPAELTAAGALSMMVFGRLSRRLPLARVTPELLGAIAFGALIIATIPFSIWPGGAFEVLTDLYVKVFLIFVLMQNTLTSAKRIEQFTWILVIASGYVATRSFLEYLNGAHLVKGTRAAGAVGGMFKNPNDLALNMVAFLPFAIFAVMRNGRPLRRLLAAGFAGLMLLAVFSTLSRGGFLGLAAMLAVVAFYGRRIRPGFVAAGAVIVLVSLPLLPSTFWSRMSSIVEPDRDDTGSREARKILMMEALQAFVDHPLTGVGAGQFKNYNPPERQERWNVAHNVLLQVAADLGIFGLAIFGFLIVRAGTAVGTMRQVLGPLRNRRRRPFVRAAGQTGPDPFTPHERQLLTTHAAAMTASLTGWFVCAMFASVAFNWTFYYVLALAVAGREVTKDRMKAAAPARARVAVA